MGFARESGSFLWGSPKWAREFRTHKSSQFLYGIYWILIILLVILIKE